MLKHTVRVCVVLVLGLALTPAQEAIAGKNRVRVDLKSSKVNRRYQNQQARFQARQAQKKPALDPIETALLKARAKEEMWDRLLIELVESVKLLASFPPFPRPEGGRWPGIMSPFWSWRL